MSLSPADRGPGPASGGIVPGSRDGWLAAPLAEPSSYAQSPVRPTAAPSPSMLPTSMSQTTAPQAVVSQGALSQTAVTQTSGRQTQGRLGRAQAMASVAIDDRTPKVSLAQASVRAGGCFVRPLPLDGTCASAARSFFREAVAGAGLPGDLIHDGVTMASELAANTLNAHGNIEYGGHGHRPVSGIPEFWLYIRNITVVDPNSARSASGRELVCKIFDSEPGWDAGEPVPIGAAVPAGRDSVRGRGLQMVAGLSAGIWGHHLSRGRLGVWKVPGKAVWFALRIPATSELARTDRLAPRGAEAIEELAAALTDRGLGTGLVPVTEPGGELAVLSVSHKLTVWCQGQAVWWQEPGGSYDRLLVTDLTEAVERIVAAHEDLVVTRQGGRGAAAVEPKDYLLPAGDETGYPEPDLYGRW